MSYNQYQQPNPLFNHSSNATTNLNYLNLNLNLTAQPEELDTAQSNEIRQDDTQLHVERLYKLTFIQRHGERNVLRTGGRKNKNEILGLTLARLVKEKHFRGQALSRDLELTRGMQVRSNNGDFVMVLRTDGRIVAISDEVEHHLGKSMRSIYTQCINMYQCLNSADGGQLRAILDRANDLNAAEQKLVCTFRLPKGKRPSRVREDVKAIAMTGHFYSCYDPTTGLNQKLFIARCEALLSQTTTSSAASQTNMVANNDHTVSMIKIVLNEDASVSSASPNVKDILGYSRNEMIGNWFGRYLTSDAVEKFEHIREKYLQNNEDQQLPPKSVCDIFDMYGENGDSRLSFLCQIRPNRERRSKAIKISIVAQLIDPSLSGEYMKHVQIESVPVSQPIRAEQVNHVPSISKTSEDAIMANSSPLDRGLLCNHFELFPAQQYSPIQRSLSDVVAPFNKHDESWFDFPELDFAAGELDYWSKPVDLSIFECQFGDDLNALFDQYL